MYNSREAFQRLLDCTWPGSRVAVTPSALQASGDLPLPPPELRRDCCWEEGRLVGCASLLGSDLLFFLLEPM